MCHIFRYHGTSRPIKRELTIYGTAKLLGKFANENAVARLGKVRESWPSMAPLGYVELTKIQKLLESKNKNEKQNQNKNKNWFLFSFSLLFSFCFSFSFLFSFLFSFSFLFLFSFWVLFLFLFWLLFLSLFSFLFFFFFLVFIFKFYYGTTRPLYSTIPRSMLINKARVVYLTSSKARTPSTIACSK